MKNLLIACALTLAYSASAFAGEPISKMNCSSLQKEWRKLDLEQLEIQHLSDRSMGGEVLMQLSIRLEFVFTRMTKMEDLMRSKRCAIPAAAPDTYVINREKACAKALDEGDYENYQKNCK